MTTVSQVLFDLASEKQKINAVPKSVGWHGEMHDVSAHTQCIVYSTFCLAQAIIGPSFAHM